MSEDRVYEELLNSGPFAIIELFQLKTFETMHGADNVYYFHAGRNRNTTEPTSNDDILNAYSIKYGGETYVPLPIEASGFEYKGDGGLPRPTIRIANLNGNITQILLGVNLITPGNDLNGAQVTRIRTLSRFLDSSNWENNQNPYGTPNYSDTGQMPKEVYYIDRKVAETRDFVEFEMVSSLDLANARAPRRLVMQNLCQWKYRGKECGYGGTTDYTSTGDQVVKTAATSYTYNSGADKLTAGSELSGGQSLVSSNGWFTAVMQADGNFVIYTKPEPTYDFYNNWASNSVRGLGDYKLVMQGDGNLVIYDNSVSRDDYNGGSVLWSPNVHKIGPVTSLTRQNDGTAAIWYPSDVGLGRSGAFSYELVGRSPTESEANSNATVTVQRQFTDVDDELGTRTITLTFTFEAFNFDPGHYTGLTRGFNRIQSVSVDAQSGFWRDGEDFAPLVRIGEIRTLGTNPFGSSANPAGTLDGTQVGPLYRLTTTGFNAKQLRLKDDGVLVVEDADGSDVTWSSDNPPVTSEPQVTTTVIPGQVVPPEIVGECEKTLDACKARFGAGALPFGSFPSVGQNN